MYNIDFFLKFFSKFPKESWGIESYNNNGKRCAMSFLYEGDKRKNSWRMYDALHELFHRLGCSVIGVNDGVASLGCNKNVQTIILENKNPKDRIIKTLKYMKEKQRL